MSVEVSKGATVAASARLGERVSVGPGCVIGPEVVVGDDCVLGPHCVLEGDLTVGASCKLSSHVVLGSAPQDLKYAGEPTRVVIGERNTFREFITVNRGTGDGGGLTTIGDDNLFMTGAHVAHDCQVGSGTIFANNATLGGHVVVLDGATIGAFSAVHQFCRVGRQAFVGGFTVCTKDILPFIKTVGGRGGVKAYGINVIGLRRRGFTEEVLDELQAAFRKLRKGRFGAAVLGELQAGEPCAELAELLSFLEVAREGRGVHA